MQFTATRRATFSASLLAALAVLPLAATSGAAPPSTSSLAAGSVSQPTYEIALQEAWIPMPDGVRLSADVFLPTGGEAGEKFPVLLEYLPYRKNEKRDRNYSLYSYFVERGFVVARVDIRGTGNSEGRTIPYEYSEIEQEDGDVVIDWLLETAVFERQRRDVRHLVGRLQRHPYGDAQPAGAQGDYRGGRNRRICTRTMCTTSTASRAWPSRGR